MSIPEYHYYHGAALSLITEQGKFTGLARTPALGSGAYAVNHDIGVFIKHTTKGKSPFHFTFAPEHQESIRKIFDRFGSKAFVLLVCGEEGICALTYGEYATVIKEDFKTQDSLTVERPGRGGFRVKGANGRLPKVIPVSRFPSIVFE